MRGIFKNILSALFKRVKKFSNRADTSTFPVIQTNLVSSQEAVNDYVSSESSLDYKNQADVLTLPAVQNNQVASQEAVDDYTNLERCQRILNYWLDAELFELPECPLDYKQQIVSKPADNFIKVWGQEAEKKFKAKKLKLTENSRLLIMFQCHRAGYLSKDEERHPNYKIPRTYLVAQAMIPRWNEKTNTIVWSRSEEESDLIFNLATMRTLYRKCRLSVPNNMSLSDWVEARMETIENILHIGLSYENDDCLINTNELQKKVISINRQLADEFWPDEEARQFMLQQCQPIESSLEDDILDAPVKAGNGTITFRWRFCYYPDGNESKQLGPFFVQDLERTINSVSELGMNGLSRPLRSYLLGENNQIEIGSAVNQGNFFLPLTKKLIYGRWPENPKYGLCLLQKVAVDIAEKASENPIVAVNGPPGTGKTTLLKDIIANRFVIRTLHIKNLSHEENWLSNKDTIKTIMRYSMVVASSNNKAVENISKELPSLGKLPEEFADQTRHFRDIAANDDWGLFCAVLGNSSNRNAFKPTLKKLHNHMRNINDYFQLNYLLNSLNKKGKEQASETLTKFVESWKNNNKLALLVADIKHCQAFHKYNPFFEPFITALTKVEQGELEIEQFTAKWHDLDEEQWELALNALDTFKRQWFGKKMYREHLAKKLKDAEKSFDILLTKIAKLGDDTNSEWQLDPHTHLTSQKSYLKNKNESEVEAEKRLQLGSPLGSTVLNKCRSELFIKALALNEALLENAASQFAKYWQDLEQLINGRLETQESIPEHQQLWSILFLFFPVVSTSLSSAEKQFKLMQKPEGFGLVMIDEAGQAINYHVAGLLQRSRQAVFVGDPIQLEPLVTMPTSIDRMIADDFLHLSKEDGEHRWGDDYLVSTSSAQSIGDNGGKYMARIGERKVGIPLLVHRRCTEPMFSIANRIAYDNRMVLASQPFEWPALQSGWINVAEHPTDIEKKGYANSIEANTALKLVQFLVEEQPLMVRGGVYIITPFSIMKSELKTQWNRKSKSPSNHDWMLKAFGSTRQVPDIKQFAKDNIGTVHTFQGKEASTVIVCKSASQIRNKGGGINWVNSKPNLLNVAITRAKHHLFVIGNQEDWSLGTFSSELQQGRMLCYDGLEQFKLQQALPFHEQRIVYKTKRTPATDISFDFG